MNNWGTNKVIEKEEVKENVNPIIFKSLKDAKVNRGIKILSYGNFGTGKTHFGLSSDSPVYILDTENGASPLADKFPEAKVLSICSSEGENVDEKDEVVNFERFEEAVNYLCLLPEANNSTIIVDSLSDVWSWCQAYAKTKIFKIPLEERFKQQFDWAVPSGMLRKLIQKLINKECNVIFTAREDEIYEGAGKPSGRYKPSVQKKVPFMVDIVLYHEIKFINKKLIYQARIEKCRVNGALVGKIIEDISIKKIKELMK